MSRAAGMTGGELARKAVHIGAGLLALLVPWLTRWQGAGICLGAFLMNWLVLPRATRRFLEREEDLRRGYAEGILEYPLSVGALFLAFGSHMPVVAAAWGILAFGDGFATLAGRTLGGPALPWNRDKTLAGFLTFVLVGGAAATGLFLWTAGTSGDPGEIARAAWMCFGAALLGAFVESAATGVNDNISVPLMAGGFLFALTLVNPPALAERLGSLVPRLPWAIGVNLAVSGLAWAVRAVHPSGAIAGLLIGVTVCSFAGWRAFAILLIFFVLASGATRVGYARKASLQIAQEEGGRRGARHAVANCGVPALLAFMAAATQQRDLFMLGLVAALATAVFDTVSTEIGQVYGRRPFLITTLRRVPPGTDGAVSLEGTLAGLASACALASASFGLGLMGTLGWGGAALAVAGAFIGTTVESYLGATAEAMRLIDNEAVNFANTLVGALSAMGLCVLVVS